jgi:hypothetical protein
MAALAPCYSWWRYPVKGPKERTLDHTTLTGKKRAVYPVRRFTKEEREAYVLQAWGGHYDVVEIRGKPPEKRTITKWSRLSFGQKAAGRILLDALPLEPPLRSLWALRFRPRIGAIRSLASWRAGCPFNMSSRSLPKACLGRPESLSALTANARQGRCPQGSRKVGSKIGLPSTALSGGAISGAHLISGNRPANTTSTPGNRIDLSHGQHCQDHRWQICAIF